MSYLRLFFPHLTIPVDGRIRRLTSGPRLGGVIQVVPRSLCQYSRKTLPRTDAVGRKAAREEARFESRFSDPEVMVHAKTNSRMPGEVVVWAWDKARLAAMTGRKNLRALPETLAREPMSNGARLVEGVDGFEGEVWVNSELVATRWWRETPNDDAWREFLLGARTGAGLNIEIPEQTPIAQRPVWKTDIAWTDDSWRTAAARITPAQLTGAVVLAALAPASCETARFSRLAYESQALTSSLEAGRETAGEWLAHRRRAMRDAALVSDASALGDEMSIVYALKDLSAVMRGQGAHITQITLSEGELRVLMSAPPRDSLAGLISELEDSPSWSQVRMDTGGIQIVGRLETVVNAKPVETAQGAGNVGP